jgi:hypothetical protein
MSVFGMFNLSLVVCSDADPAWSVLPATRRAMFLPA